MSLASRLATPPIDHSKQYCAVGRLLDELLLLAGGVTDNPTSEYTALNSALANMYWKSTDIRRTLLDEGHDISLRHLRAHRNHEHLLQDCAHPDAGILS